LPLSILIAACAGPIAAPTPTGIDTAAAAAQALTFHTMATPDRWANYGGNFGAFCQARFGFDCNREDRDPGGG
jgi:hypothetical protein